MIERTSPIILLIFSNVEYLSLQAQQEHQASMGPRSSSEMTNDSAPKFRQLPCRTFISVGTCPYRERCVYLHDPRVICREAKTKTRRKNKEDTVVDTLFWPIMPYAQVASKLDNNRQPHVIQNYIVPPPQSDQFYRHDQAVYSMWMHFVDFCSACAASENGRDNIVACYQAPDTPTNAYTKGARLAIFRSLSNSNGVSLTPGNAVPKERSHSPTTVSSMMSPIHSQEAPCDPVKVVALTASNLASAKSLLPPPALSLLSASKYRRGGLETSSLTSDESFTNSNSHSIMADLELDDIPVGPGASYSLF